MFGIGIPELLIILVIILIIRELLNNLNFSFDKSISLNPKHDSA